MKKILLLISLFWFTDSAFAQIEIIVNNGNNFTKSPKITLTIKAVNAVEMAISNDPFPEKKENIKWQPYTRTIPWDLIPGDDLKVLFFKFKFRNGFISETINKTITLDSSAPKIYYIDMGSGNFAKARNQQIRIDSDQAYQMRVSNHPHFKNTYWMPFHRSLFFELSSGEGQKIIYLQLRDHAGNESKIKEKIITFDRTPPTNSKIEMSSDYLVHDTINDIKYVNKKSVFVDLTLHSDNAKYMALSNNVAFNRMRWIFYAEEYLSWELDNADEGRHKVYIKFKDIAQNQTNIIYDEILIDTEPPLSPRILINNGQKFTNTTKVNLSLYCPESIEFKASNNSLLNDSEFEKLTYEKEWRINPEEGSQWVYIVYRDEAHNVTNMVADEIILDQTPPTNGFISIENGNTQTLNPHVTIEVKAQEARWMQISEDSTFSTTPWREYRTNPLKFDLSKGYGEKTFYTRFKDIAGNISKTISSSILFEVIPIRTKIKVDNNAEFTNNKKKEVRLNIYSLHGEQMRISQTPGFNNIKWEPYKKIKDITLDGGDGEKVVYVQFKSKTNTLSEIKSDRVILDRTPPSNLSIRSLENSNKTSQTNIDIDVSANDAKKMQISEHPNFEHARWLPYSNYKFSFNLSAKPGEKMIYFRCKDEHQNISKAVSTKIHLDFHAPSTEHFRINNGIKITKSNMVKISTQSHHAHLMRVSEDYRNISNMEWDIYDPDKSWMLTNKEGIRTVYVQFKDDADNISPVYSSQLEIDTSPPKNGNAKIIGNPFFVNRTNRKVKLTLHAQGATRYMISNTADFSDAGWRRYRQETVLWQLTEGDGDKFVNIKFADIAGNESEVIQIATVLDRSIEGDFQFSINRGAHLTNQEKVTLDFITTGDTPKEVLISNRADCGAPAKWQKYDYSFDWWLPHGDGEKIIYVKFRDDAGNETMPISQKIYVDTEAPVPHYLQLNKEATAVEGLEVTLYTKLKDVKSIKVSNVPSLSDAIWEPYFPEIKWNLQGEGYQKIYVQFKDAAGNESKIFTDNITAYLTQ